MPAFVAVGSRDRLGQTPTAHAPTEAVSGRGGCRGEVAIQIDSRILGAEPLHATRKGGIRPGSAIKGAHIQPVHTARSRITTQNGWSAGGLPART